MINLSSLKKESFGQIVYHNIIILLNVTYIQLYDTSFEKTLL